MAANAGRKILIIDDSELCLQMEQSILGRAGFDVRTAATLHAFDRLLHEWLPDIVLTDVKMPELDGAELCRYVRRHMRAAHIPVVLFSVLPDTELERLADRCGADGFVSKHNGLNKLVERIEELWGSILW